MSALSVTAFCRAQASTRDALGEVLLSLVAPTREEVGSIRYDVLQAVDDPDLWLVREEWRSRADFDRHMATSHVVGFLARVSELCAGEIDLRFFATRSPRA
jgi:quinol monooxygenase YgiN